MLISKGERKATIYRRRPDRYAIPAKKPKITPEILAAFDTEAEAFQDTKDIAAALVQIPDEAEKPSDESLRASLKAMRDVGFTVAEKRKRALSLFIRASQNGKNNESSEILRKTEQGPGIRLWHLQNF